MKSWSTVDQLVDWKSILLINSWSTLLIYFNLLINCWLTCWPWHVDQLLINMLIPSAKNSNSTCWSTVDQLVDSTFNNVDQQLINMLNEFNLLMNCWPTCWFHVQSIHIRKVDQLLINKLICFCYQFNRRNWPIFCVRR